MLIFTDYNIFEILAGMQKQNQQKEILRLSPDEFPALSAQGAFKVESFGLLPIKLRAFYYITILVDYNLATNNNSI